MKSAAFFLALVLLAAPGLARPQKPANNPRPGRTTGVEGGRQPGAYVFQGTVQSRSVSQLVVKSENGQAKTFTLSDKTGIADTVQAGSRVLVSFQGTLDAGVMEAVNVKELPAKKKKNK